MNTRTLDVALRIATDLNGAVADLGKLEDAQKRVELAASRLGRAQSALANVQASGKASADQLAKAQEAVTRAELALSSATAGTTKAQTALATATQKTATVQQKGAVSAAQHAMAMRQLPMQITDIVTGLASGQSVFMVAIQQGGQLKDSFGGIGPAARALVGAISPTVAVLGAGAAALGLMATGLFQVYEEQRQFTNALLQTGNYADVTVGSLDAMVVTLGNLEAVGKGTARDALVQVAESGRFAGEQFDLVATAAARMEAATGQSIDTTVKKFEEIARDPVAALLKLNETEHFLTQAQLDRVAALVDEGREQDAAAEGARIYAGRLDEIATAAINARPHLAKLWDDAKKGAAEAWESTKDIAEFLAASGDKFSELPWYRRGGMVGAVSFLQSMYQAEPATPAQVARVPGAVESREAQERLKQAAKEREQAERNWDQRAIGDLEKKAKLEEKIKEIRREGALLKKSDQEIEAQIANARARYAESLPKGKKASGKTDAQQDEEAAKRELENLQKQIALTATLADGERQVSNEARVAYEIKEGAYRLSSQATQQAVLAAARERDAQLEAAEAAEKKKKADEDAKKAYERLKDELRTPAEIALDEVTAKVQVLNDQLTRGKIEAAEYKAQLARIFKQSETKAPELPGQFQSYGGPIGDAADLAAYSAQLETWRANEISATNAYYATVEGGERAHQERLAAIQAEYGTKQAAYSQAQSQFMLSTAASVFGSLAEIARNSAGEQSKTYRALFALSQGFAVAQALIAVYQNAAEASKQAGGYPYNIPIIAGAIAQGLAIVAQIRAVQPAAAYATGGRIVGPGTPTSDSVPIWASRDEHMIRAASATQPGARAFLDDFNERGMPALYDWARAGAFADGGAITAMAEPRARLASPSAVASPVHNDMAVAFFNDREKMMGWMVSHPKFREAVVIEASENGNAISHSWQTGG